MIAGYWLSVVITNQDFVSSVSTLLTVRHGTVHLRRRIGELDGQMGDVGRALGEKVSLEAYSCFTPTTSKQALCAPETFSVATADYRSQYGRSDGDASELSACSRWR